VPLHDAQRLIREIVVVRHVSETPDWRQVSTVRFYNQWQLWRLVHSEHAENIPGDNKRRLVGELKILVRCTLRAAQATRTFRLETGRARTSGACSRHANRQLPCRISPTRA